MSSLLHVYIAPAKGITAEQVEKVFDLAVDWYRCSSRCYVLYTTADPTKWRERCEKLVKPDGNLLICKLDPTEYHGWMPKNFWEWFEAKAKKASGT